MPEQFDTESLVLMEAPFLNVTARFVTLLVLVTLHPSPIIVHVLLEVTNVTFASVAQDLVHLFLNKVNSVTPLKTITVLIPFAVVQPVLANPEMKTLYVTDNKPMLLLVTPFANVKSVKLESAPILESFSTTKLVAKVSMLVHLLVVLVDTVIKLKSSLLQLVQTVETLTLKAVQSYSVTETVNVEKTLLMADLVPIPKSHIKNVPPLDNANLILAPLESVLQAFKTLMESLVKVTFPPTVYQDNVSPENVNQQSKPTALVALNTKTARLVLEDLSQTREIWKSQLMYVDTIQIWPNVEYNAAGVMDNAWKLDKLIYIINISHLVHP